MDSIVNFYKSLDMINLIIFWGIVIVIILILILVFIMIYKKKKSKKTSVNNTDNIKYEEELPIKQEESIISNSSEIGLKQEPVMFTSKPDEIFNEPQVVNRPIVQETKIEQKTIMETPNEIPKDNMPQEKIMEQKEQVNNNVNKNIQMPTGPYQRNVLREMSLSQTSPIGINRKDIYEEKRTAMVKDLSNSLNYEQKDKNLEINDMMKQELNNIEKTLLRKTEIINEYSQKEKTIMKQELNHIDNETNRKTEMIGKYQQKEMPIEKKIEPSIQTNNIVNIEQKDYLPKELLELDSNIQKEKSLSEKYLEEVSQKLSETEVNDEIERTHYELKQEEDAIISYKELMEKKDSIQTIDEEDAVISIEELMNRENNKQQEENKDARLYNLNETEKNDDFIKELKQFRKDL